MEPIRIEIPSAGGGFLVMIGLFGIAFSVSATADARIDWRTGLFLSAVSLATIYVVYTHPRFRYWLDCGEQLEYRDFFRLNRYEWDQVREIRYVSTSDTSDTEIILANGMTLRTWEPPEKFREIARSLFPMMASGGFRTRRRVTDALGKIARIDCRDSYLKGPIIEFQWVAEMRGEIIAHLEKALQDPDELVRSSVVNALENVRLKITEEEHTTRR